MDFDYSDEQRQLKDSVERFVREHYTFEKWRQIAATESGCCEHHWQQMAALGWLGAALGNEFGGSGGGAVETSIIMEGLGRGLVAEPYLSTAVLGGSVISEAGSAAQKDELLPKLVAGELRLALAFAEPQARFNLSDVTTSARNSGDGYVIEGQKIVVLDAAAADKLIVTARTSGAQMDRDGISLFLIDPTTPGVTIRSYRTIDSRRAADLGFNKVQVERNALIGTMGQGLPIMELVADVAISALAAEGVGCMEALCSTTNDYLKARKQFGRSIGHFQVVQHRMVEIWMALEHARSMSLMLAIKLREPSQRAKAAAATKTVIGQAGRFIGQQAIQLHGAMGMSDDLAVGHFMKRLLMIDILFGNADHHRSRFAELPASGAAWVR